MLYVWDVTYFVVSSMCSGSGGFGDDCIRDAHQGMNFPPYMNHPINCITLMMLSHKCEVQHTVAQEARAAHPSLMNHRYMVGPIYYFCGYVATELVMQ